VPWTPACRGVRGRHNPRAASAVIASHSDDSNVFPAATTQGRHATLQSRNPKYFQQ